MPPRRVARLVLGILYFAIGTVVDTHPTTLNTQVNVADIRNVGKPGNPISIEYFTKNDPSILLGLTLYKTVGHIRSKVTHTPVIELFFRDGVVYFTM